MTTLATYSASSFSGARWMNLDQPPALAFSNRPPMRAADFAVVSTCLLLEVVELAPEIPRISVAFDAALGRLRQRARFPEEGSYLKKDLDKTQVSHLRHARDRDGVQKVIKPFEVEVPEAPPVVAEDGGQLLKRLHGCPNRTYEAADHGFLVETLLQHCNPSCRPYGKDRKYRLRPRGRCRSIEPATLLPSEIAVSHDGNAATIPARAA